MPAAFFDMDRTLLTINSGSLWVRFLRRRGEISRWQYARALGWALEYKLSILDMHALAERLAADLTGQAEEDMVAKCVYWYRTEVQRTVAAPALAAIEEHRRRGERVLLLTSATNYIAAPVAEGVGLDGVICSRLEVAEGRFTGRMMRPICYGAGKVERAESWAESEGIDLRDTTFYTDSYTDLPMLERVGHPVAVNPDPRLRRAARQRGWPVRDWLGSAS
jgi:HAD superfamily hydrolase (TIGR01490 family)